MTKNTAGQVIGVQMVSATDGSAFTGSVTVAVTGDGGTQATGSVGSGACTHEGNGYHTYAPAQAETNYNLIAFTFTGTGAIPATVQVLTTAQAKGTTTLATAASLATVDGVADSILSYLIQLVPPTGAVVDDASNSASTFETNLTETADDHWNGAFLVFLTGDLAGQVRQITDYNGTTKFVTFSTAFTAEPTATDTFAVVNK